VIRKSNVPENRRANIYFMFKSPLPGNFVISLHYKGKRYWPPLQLSRVTVVNMTTQGVLEDSWNWT